MVIFRCFIYVLFFSFLLDAADSGEETSSDVGKLYIACSLGCFPEQPEMGSKFKMPCRVMTYCDENGNRKCFNGVLAYETPLEAVIAGAFESNISERRVRCRNSVFEIKVSNKNVSGNFIDLVYPSINIVLLFASSGGSVKSGYPGAFASNVFRSPADKPKPQVVMSVHSIINLNTFIRENLESGLLRLYRLPQDGSVPIRREFEQREAIAQQELIRFFADFLAPLMPASLAAGLGFVRNIMNF